MTRNKTLDSFRSRHPPHTLDWSPRDTEGLSTEERHLYWRVHASTQKSRDSLLANSKHYTRCVDTSTTSSLHHWRTTGATDYRQPSVDRNDWLSTADQQVSRGRIPITVYPTSLHKSLVPWTRSTRTVSIIQNTRVLVKLVFDTGLSAIRPVRDSQSPPGRLRTGEKYNIEDTLTVNYRVVSLYLLI